MEFVLKLVTVLVLAVLIAGGLLLFTPLGDESLSGVFPVGEVEPVEFASLQLTENPNQFLMCPPGRCSAQAHAESPVFGFPVEELRKRWDAIVAAEPRLTVLERDRSGFQVDYVQRSARFRFPDVITVRFVEVPDERSSLAVYSRSLFGKSDLGVNRERIEAWVAALEEDG